MRELLQKLISTSAAQTEEAGANFASSLPSDAFVAMYGDLGAGKTAFVRGMASVLTPEAAVSSPTYTLVNEYRDNGRVFCHFDMYRINDEDDLCSIGFYDYKDCIIAAEWSEKITFALPDKYYSITILKLDDEAGASGVEDNRRRCITIERVSGNEN